MAIGKILSTLLNEKGISRGELAKRVGVTPSTIGSIIERDNAGIKITLLNDICKELEVSPELFFEDFANRSSGIDDVFSQNEKKHIKKYRSLDEFGKKTVDSVLNIEFERCTNKNESVPLSLELPISVYAASAGTGNWLDEEYTERVKVLDTPQARKANLVIKVAGDSMKPLYSDGDKVLVKIQPDVELGEIGIFIVDREGYIKKKGESELISVNPAYDNIKILEYTDYRCFGKVLGKAEMVK